MREKSVIVLAVDVVTLVIGLPANVLALYSFSAQIRDRLSPTAILLLNLTVSDFLFLTVLLGMGR